MADTKHHHATTSSPPPVEGDGISYSGIVWFVVVLTVTTVGCQLLMVGLFAYLDHRSANEAVPRPALAAPAGQLPPAPTLLLDEPGNLQTFRKGEQGALTTYDWVDKETGVVRLPIDRAKELILERGFAVRETTEKKPEGTEKKPEATGKKQ
jgi:hypothetical protein